MQPREVLQFWFPDLSRADHATLIRQFEWWFRGGGDATIVEQYPALWERAARGKLKTFFFMPLGHSEELAHQETAVRLAEELAVDAPVPFRKALEHSASQARGHRDVIVRFGRHPHRNVVLGRESTPEELDYLAREQLVHTRSVAR